MDGRPIVATFLCYLALQVQAKDVFAHFMVENVASWDNNAWEDEIRIAQAAHIDAFALNIRVNDATAGTSLDYAFVAAQNTGFHLFLSFDYAGGGPWALNDVITYINGYSSNSQYYTYGGKPFVSTFEGPNNAADWITIKDKTGCFFVPDWSSSGAKAALGLSPGVPDGLFSWAAWPWGDLDMNTYVDASYLQYLNDSSPDLTYMMPVSPWFYTNLPGYDKNWLWRGDDLWYDRWQEVWFVQPEFVEILTWNDYGESHYIGPIHDEEMDAFTVGKAPFNYANDMPHDAWRLFLPFVIDMYKTGTATISQEGLSVWYRLTPKAACSDEGGTTGNTASQLQIEFDPKDVVQDNVFFSALLATSQSVSVTVGGVDLGASWAHKPDGGVGLYHGSVAYGNNLGEVVVTVGSMAFTGQPIVGSCDSAPGQNGMTNWNAWTGSTTGASVDTTPALKLEDQVCIEGTGVGNYEGLCSFGCGYGYCPIGACTCLRMGAQVDLPTADDTSGFGTVGYPAEGLDATYSGLCSFDCYYGYCPAGTCGTTEYSLTIATVSPFLPDACTAGTGDGNLGGLCGYACAYGYCPIHSCTCVSEGPLNVPPASNSGSGYAADGLDPDLYDGLCDFACSRGYCPEGACLPEGTSSTGSFIVYVDPSIWDGGKPPVIPCYPPCTLIIPPYPLPESTTISLDPLSTTLEVVSSIGPTTTTYEGGYVSTYIVYNTTILTTTIQIPPVVTGEIPWWNVIIPETDATTAVITLTTSVLPPPFTIPDPDPGDDAHSGAPRTIHPAPWPKTAPTTAPSVTSGPPKTFTWTSSAPGSKCTANCGSRCVGLFCDIGCFICPNPDPDWWDPIDPNTPWPTDEPYEPEDEECTTTSADHCSTTYVVASSSTSTVTSCSLTYGCSASASATATTQSGTYTPAPWGTFISEAWPTSDPGDAYSSSVFNDAASWVNSYWPDLSAIPSTTSTKTTSTASPSPTSLGLGDACEDSGECAAISCPSGQSPACVLDETKGETQATCQCVNNKPPPPYGTLCTDVAPCNEFYACGDGLTMNCVETSYSNGNDVCLCT